MDLKKLRYLFFCCNARCLRKRRDKYWYHSSVLRSEKRLYVFQGGGCIICKNHSLHGKWERRFGSRAKERNWMWQYRIPCSSTKYRSRTGKMVVLPDCLAFFQKRCGTAYDRKCWTKTCSQSLFGKIRIANTEFKRTTISDRSTGSC